MFMLLDCDQVLIPVSSAFLAVVYADDYNLQLIHFQGLAAVVGIGF